MALMIFHKKDMRSTRPQQDKMVVAFANHQIVGLIGVSHDGSFFLAKGHAHQLQM